MTLRDSLPSAVDDPLLVDPAVFCGNTLEDWAASNPGKWLDTLHFEIDTLTFSMLIIITLHSVTDDPGRRTFDA